MFDKTNLSLAAAGGAMGHVNLLYYATVRKPWIFYNAIHIINITNFVAASYIQARSLISQSKEDLLTLNGRDAEFTYMV